MKPTQDGFYHLVYLNLEIHMIKKNINIIIL